MSKEAGSGGPESPARETAAVERNSLFRKYFLALFVAVLVPLLANGASEAWLGYRDQRAMIETLLRAEADSAARRIEGFLGGIVDQLGWMTHLPATADTLEQRRFDALRLLRQVPAVTDLAQLDADGREQLRISRMALDVVGSGADRSAEPAYVAAAARKPYFGPVYFRRDSEPYMAMAVAGPRRSAGVSIADVNLKLIWDVLAKVKVGEAGYAYATDGEGRLIAHPDTSRVLRGGDQINPVTRDEIPEASDSSRIAIRNAAGGTQIAAMAPVGGARWIVWVEQPLAEAFAPIYGALRRTGILLVGGAVLAAALAYLLARRMTGPIKLLEQGAGEIGAGNFQHRIAITTGDELERLAGRFNEMADELALSRDRFARISRLRQFLAPQVAEMVEQAGHETLLDTQRVEVAVIFCDLRNFTAFSARAEPDEIMGVLGEYYSVLGPIIASHEATQTSFSGDGLMMLMNAPLACPEPALRAVRMAIEMRAAVGDLAVGWRERGHAIGFGIGVAKGPATVGSVGHENRLDYTAIGSVVNLASRLCSAAKDGQILIDPRAAEEAGSDVRLESMGKLPLKGFDEQVAVYAVDAGVASDTGVGGSVRDSAPP